MRETEVILLNFVIIFIGGTDWFIGYVTIIAYFIQTTQYC
jgi:hypothetical protein